jgi:two-component system, NarL family, response regulator LiaR
LSGWDLGLPFGAREPLIKSASLYQHSLSIRETVVVREVLVPAEAPAPFAPNTAHQQTLGITARELEILTLIARGFSNREIATQLFVSENTVKTHCARAFDKLGAARRTQAVQRGKELGLLP